MEKKISDYRWYLFAATVLFLMFFIGKVLVFYPYSLNEERLANVREYSGEIVKSSKSRMTSDLFVRLRIDAAHGEENASFYTNKEDLLRGMSGREVLAYISKESWPYSNKVWRLTGADGEMIVSYSEMHRFYARSFWFAFSVCSFLFMGILFCSLKLYWLYKAKHKNEEKRPE